MASIRRFFNVDTGVAAQTMPRVVQLLLETVAQHAVEYDPAELHAFRTELRQIQGQLAAAAGAPDYLVRAGEANRAIDTYNRGVERYIRGQSAELNAIIALLTNALLSVVARAQLSAGNLRQLEHELHKASQLDDLRLLKSKMSDALQTICDQANQAELHTKELRNQIAETQSMHRRAMGAPMAPVEGSCEVDPLTGLSGRKQALDYMNHLAQSGRAFYVLVMAIERLDIINSRFGSTSGDHVTLRVSQHLAQGLSCDDQLFRWRGGCFVAVLIRHQPVEIVRAEASRLCADRPEIELGIGDRHVIMRVSMAWNLMPVLKDSEAAELNRRLEAFAGEQFHRNPSGVH
jgi:GGDEF domain-containing protein